ncbi:MAG: hypothetical protein ACXVNM_05915 [Bacteroidia bacterium]
MKKFIINGGFEKKQRLIKQSMEKEQWIKEVLESTKNLERLQASPFLVERVLTKIEGWKAKEKQNAPGLKWAFGLAAVLFIVVNIASLTKALHNKEGGNRAEAQQLAEGINNQVIYNY